MLIKKIFFFLILYLFIFTNLYSQEKFTLSGIISDSKSNETLIGVNIIIKDKNAFAITNEYGFYSITLPKGDYSIIISSVGFQNIEESVKLYENIKRNYGLNDSGMELEEVIITEKSKSNIRKPEMSVNKMSIATIKQMPVVLGEVDVLKSILFLPGVTNAGEGASGFNVRGGGADQNLILLDEATIFNSSHVFGFFSVFNPDAIKDLKLYKGGIPARFGGRASSVLDIYQKDGNSKEFHVNGGIGLISSRILAEGPIIKDKGSFLIGGRGSYAHLFLKLVDNNNSAYFYDLNTKLNYKINKNNNLYVSGYFGRDVFSLDKNFTNIYGNSTLNVRWNHLFSEKLFSNLSAIYSDYYYGLQLDFVGFDWQSGIKNYNVKYDFKYYLSDKIKLSYGANAIYYSFNPGKIVPLNSNSGINSRQLEKKSALEPAFYIDAEHKITNKFAINYGLRYSMFYRLGSSIENVYLNDQAVTYDSEFELYEKAKPISAKQFTKNQTLASFNNLEPRFAMAYEINNQKSVKLSYNRMVQYLQLISNTSSPTPLDIWTPSDRYIQPQIADQVAIGWFSNFKDETYSVEIESYYKNIKNRLDYIDGADLIANEALEQVLLNGQLRSYGLEFMLRKNTGKFTGWLSYTISKSQQKTVGRNPTEVGINNGDWYRSAYDKLHNLAITTTYNYNKKWTLGSSFTFQTGQPTTFPNGQFVFQGFSIPSYSLRNKNSLPSYHHLDISATYTPKRDKKSKWQGEWVFSIYNLYARKNAASISFGQNAFFGNNETVKLSIFGIVPAATYNFKF